MSEHPGQSDITFCIDVENDGSSHVSVIKKKVFQMFRQVFLQTDREALM